VKSNEEIATFNDEQIAIHKKLLEASTLPEKETQEASI
jgi:hypothetical protein